MEPTSRASTPPTDLRAWVDNWGPKAFDAVRERPLSPARQITVNWITDKLQEFVRRASHRLLTGTSFDDIPAERRNEYLVWEGGVNHIVPGWNSGYELVQRFETYIGVWSPADGK
jgi:hypothetical protein